MKNLHEKEEQVSQSPEPSGQYKQRFHLSGLEVLFGTLIFLGLLYVGYFIFFQESGRSSGKIEKRLKVIEAGTVEQADKIDKQTKQLQSNQAQLEARVKALENTNQALAAKIQRLEKRSGK